MKARIRFSSEVYIEGETLDEIREKWENLPLFSADALDCSAEYIEQQEVTRVDDMSYSDLGTL